MASIVTRTRKDGKRSHHVKYRAGYGRVRWEHVPGDKRAAKARARQIEDQLHKTGGRWTPPANVKCDEYADQWLEEYARHAVSPRVYDNYARSLRLVWKPAVGQLPLAAVTRTHIKTIIAKQRAEGKADNTIRNNMIPIREMLSYAVDDGLIASNPATALKIAEGKRKKIVPPSSAQVSQLITKARPEAREAITVAAVTGLRRGELFALRWEDVDFRARTIRVHATNHRAQITENTKTEAGERFVPLFESARKVLVARKLRTRFN